MKYSFSFLTLVSLLGTGCADLTVETVCSRDPNDPRCPQDTALDTTVADAVDAAADGGDVGDSRLDVTSLDVDPDVTPDVPDPLDARDSGVDSDATIDISADAIDSTLADTTDTLDSAPPDSTPDVTPDAADSTVDADTSVATDSRADSDSGSDTADVGCVGPSTQACGNCGSQSRTCTAGTWSAFGTCTGVGECAVGSTTTATGCAWYETGTKTCDATCRYGSPVCSKVSGWRAIATPPAEALSISVNYAPVLVGNEIILLCTSNGKTYSYDVRTNVWKTKAAQPATFNATEQCNVVSYAGRAWVFGGIITAGSYSNELHSYEPATNTWRRHKTSSLPVRGLVAMAAYQGHIVVSGGIDAVNTKLGDGARYFPGTDVWTALPDTEPRGPIVASADASGVVSFGIEGSGSPFAVGASLLGPGWSWTRLTSPVSLMNDADCSAATGGNVGFGCLMNSPGMLTFLRYDAGTWTTSTAIPSAVTSGGTSIWCDATTCNLYGGGTPPKGTGSIFTVSSKTWKSMPSGPARTSGRAFTVGGVVVLMGGDTWTGTETTSVLSGSLYIP